MSSKRNQTIAIARFLMYKHGLNQQLEGMTDEEYLAHPIGLDVGQYVADLMKYCPEHIVDQVMEHGEFARMLFCGAWVRIISPS